MASGEYVVEFVTHVNADMCIHNADIFNKGKTGLDKI